MGTAGNRVGTPGLNLAAWEGTADEEVVQRVLAGETALYEILMRRYNRRLYRVARSILRNDVDAEDVMQEAYVRAYEHLNQFAGEAKFSTWLTKIAVYEALGRLRRQGRTENLGSVLDSDRHAMARMTSDTRDPERQAYDHELRIVLEGAIDSLPEPYRLVFVLRTVEGMSVAETAGCLDIGVEAVKTRLHRARSLLRKDLQQRAGLVTAQAFPFHLSRCDRVVEAVFRRIAPGM
ncbi:MAG TPA: RNA polymerase sigma factor [Bryobacteraceae bacterium]|nr:RNA polymerase sigma factor [Bryobacteraceae bacterium]